MTVALAPTRPGLLVLTSTYPRWRDDHEPGFVHELVRRLGDRFEVTVLGPHAAGAATHETLDGVDVRRYRYAPAALETLVNDGGVVTNLRLHPWKWLLVPGFVAAQAWAAWRLLRSGRYAVVHAHWLVPQGLVAAALPSRIPFVVTSHGADLFALKGALARRLRQAVVKRAAALTVVSSAMRDALAGEGVPPAKVEVLPMGVDFEQRFRPADADERADDSLLFVGRLVEKKGLSHLLAALPAVLAARPGLRLRIAGHGPDDAALRATADALGVAHAVEFLGPLPQAQLPSLYRGATLFVAPFVTAVSGDQEGLPVALMEAIACGCPVVAGEVAGLRDLVDGEDDGWLVDPRDPAALAAAILAALAAPARIRAAAARMRDVLQDRIGWVPIAAGYGRVLESAVRLGASR